jgi:hypothetical protein
MMKRKKAYIGFSDSFLDLGASLGLVGFEQHHGSQENSQSSFEDPGYGHGYGRTSEEDDTGDMNHPC